VTDTLPAGLTFVSGTDSAATFGCSVTGTASGRRRRPASRSRPARRCPSPSWPTWRRARSAPSPTRPR
jgi:hypothetical protein